MSEAKREEFRALVKAAHDAIDEYAESRFAGNTDFWIRGLDMKVRDAAEKVASFGVTVNEPKPCCQVCGGTDVRIGSAKYGSFCSPEHLDQWKAYQEQASVKT